MTEMITVLVIEDDARIAVLNQRMVDKAEHFQVIGLATNEREAKEQLELLEPDLVILDVYFPDMSGLELLAYIKEHHRSTDVIMLTAANDADTVVEAVRLGVVDFITKPILFERLFQTLEQYRMFRLTVQSWRADNGPVQQSEIDRLLAGGALHQPSQIQAGSPDPITYKKVLERLAAHDSMTAEQIGTLIGMSRSTARRYLEALVQSGQAEADLHYGAVGRPEKHYRLKKAAQ